MTVWLLTVAVAVIAVIMKAVGPIAVGGRSLPRRARGVLELLAPALLAALVAIQVFTQEQRLVLDARAAGLAAAAATLLLRGPALLAMLAAAITTAVVRLVW
jgi:branched-subunit amino acid transport protein